MHNIEPHFRWLSYYDSSNDKKSPFYNKQYNYELLSETIYGYYIHPAWDGIGSETLYIKLLMVDYKQKYAIIECIGEWNDALHNDIMFFKTNVIDVLIANKITKFILIGENIFNFHGSDDCYYEEWFEDIENGWLASIGFRDFVLREWRKFGIDSYINFGGDMEMLHWRTLLPLHIFQHIDNLISKRLH